MKKLLAGLALLLAAAGCGGAAVGEEPSTATPTRTIDRTAGYTVTRPAVRDRGTAQSPSDLPSPPECVPSAPTPTPTLNEGCPEACRDCWMTELTPGYIARPIGNSCDGCPQATVYPPKDPVTGIRPPVGFDPVCHGTTPILGNPISCCIINWANGHKAEATWYTDNATCEPGKGTKQTGTYHAGRNEFVSVGYYHLCDGESVDYISAAKAKAAELGFCFLNISISYSTPSCRKDPSGTLDCSCLPHDQDPRNNF